mmetsp:Transcript_29261/g.90927  ORF Transcript_29261/g.90927 Transcript_29261/m.90927 type:complete len:315 (-) Transcript_29261:2-946(-)
MASGLLRPNPSGCQLFEPGLFLCRKCRHCGHPWQLHEGALSDRHCQIFSMFQQQRSATDQARLAAVMLAQARARRRAAEEDWLHDGPTTDASDDSSSSDSGNDGFRMFFGVDLPQAPNSAAIQRQQSGNAGHFRGPRIRNLVDFAESNVPTGGPPARAVRSPSATSSRPAATAAAASPAATASNGGAALTGQSSAAAPEALQSRTLLLPMPTLALLVVMASAAVVAAAAAAVAVVATKSGKVTEFLGLEKQPFDGAPLEPKTVAAGLPGEAEALSEREAKIKSVGAGDAIIEYPCGDMKEPEAEWDTGAASSNL